jgi:hypothetical protein
VNTGETIGWMLAGQWSGHAAQITSSAIIWVAVPLAIGAIRITAAISTETRKRNQLRINHFVANAICFAIRARKCQ